MIIVAGMHRSGTSAVTQVLSEIGMDLGDRDELLAADNWNAEGYCENLRVLTCNDRLVLGGGSLYPKRYYRMARSARPLPTRLWMSLLWLRFLVRQNEAPIKRRAELFAQEMREIASSFAGLTVKDPRFSVTLPAWRRHDAVERVLVIIRRPEDVAASLARRNRLPRVLGLSIWAFHYHALMSALPGVPVVFVDFNRLLHPDTCDGELDRVGVLRAAGSTPR